MKKKYIRLVFGALSLLSFSAAKAQTYSSGDITAVAIPNMTHDSTTCSSTCMLMYNLTIANSFMNDSVKIVDTNTMSLIYATGNTTGTTPWTVMVPVPIFNSPMPDHMLMGGSMAMFFGPNIKIVCGPDTVYANNNFMLPVSDPCDYGDVSGKMYVDNNGDCTFNSGDVPLNGVQVNALATLTSTSGSFANATASSSAGTYTMTVQKSWMTNYTVALPSSYYFIFPATSCFSGAYTFTTLPQVNVDFPMQCTSNIDVQCGAGSPGNARPLLPFYMQPFVSNLGCDSASGTLTLVKDNRVTYNAALSSNPATYVSGDTLRWNYSNLTNLSSGAYWNSFASSIHLTPNSTVAIGDTLCFRVYANVPAGDVNAANNDQSFCIPVVASYDPNMKEVSPKGTGTQGYIPASTPTLSYTIHFQNTGTAAAYDVSVVDTFDTDVNINSLKIRGTSHNMTPEWIAPRVVKFKFQGINLPDSTSNEPASHGYVSFNINPNTGLAPGTQIKNKGYIYFDSNPAVITNTALNTIAIPTAVYAVTTPGNVNIYPNPATDRLYVENMNSGTITIVNAGGAVVMERAVSGKAELNISHLPAGIYILKAIDNNSTTVKRFTKL